MKKRLIIFGLFTAALFYSNMLFCQIETQLKCISEEQKDNNQKFILFNADIQKTQMGIIEVSLTFDSVQADNIIRIRSVKSNFMRLYNYECFKAEDILYEWFVHETPPPNKTCLKYERELLYKMNNCKCQITFYKKNIPLKTKYTASFIVFPDSITYKQWKTEISTGL